MIWYQTQIHQNNMTVLQQENLDMDMWFIPLFTGHVVTYPCWYQSQSMCVKEAPGLLSMTSTPFSSKEARINTIAN